MNRGKLVFAQLMQHLSVDHLPPLRYPLSRRVQSEVLLVPGSIPVHGVRSVDLSGEPSRHRSMSARAKFQTLSSRDSFGGGSEAPLRRIRFKDPETAKTLNKYNDVGLRFGCGNGEGRALDL